MRSSANAATAGAMLSQKAPRRAQGGRPHHMKGPGVAAGTTQAAYKVKLKLKLV